MYRVLLLVAVVLAFFAPRAQAIEMFTNFHNGENIGFPALEVPLEDYGHGGWKASANCPQHIPSIESVPAMSPTGYTRCDRNWRLFGHHAVAQNKTEARGGSENQPKDASPPEYVSDRRRSWGRNADAPSSNYSNQNSGQSWNQGSGQVVEESSGSQTPTPAKAAASGSGASDNAPAGAARDEPAKAPISVFAHPGNAPAANSSNKLKSTAQPKASNAKPASTTDKSSRINNDYIKAGNS